MTGTRNGKEHPQTNFKLKITQGGVVYLKYVEEEIRIDRFYLEMMIDEVER